MKNKFMQVLVEINLVLLSIILLGKISILGDVILVVTKTFLIPLLIAILIYYIIRPLNNIFLNKKISAGRAGLLTLLIFIFIFSGIFSFFSRYVYIQFEQIKRQLWTIIYDKHQLDGIISWVYKFIDFQKVFSLLTISIQQYFIKSGYIFMKCIKYCFNTFSTFFLIIVIVYYLLKDGHKLKKSILKFIPERFVKITDAILSDCDEILNHYVTGQAKVALSLAVMIFIGYIIIGMPNAILFSGITFILAFIPFLGFFVSMIIPSIIALSMGYIMILKLIAVFIIVQTLKGRVVVPVVMSKTMDIHPITDICLVIIAVAIGGPFAAFVAVPVYAIIKNSIIIIIKTCKPFKYTR